MQPEVFDRMCEIRDEMWPQANGKPRFDPSAFVVMVHDVLKLWPHSFYSKAFLHPAFPNDLDPDVISECAKQMTMKRVIYDEVEWSDLAFVCPKWRVAVAHDAGDRCLNTTNTQWDDAPLSERVRAYKTAMNNAGYPSEFTFDDCDAIIRAGFTKGDRYLIDAGRFPLR